MRTLSVLFLTLVGAGIGLAQEQQTPAGRFFEFGQEKQTQAGRFFGPLANGTLTVKQPVRPTVAPVIASRPAAASTCAVPLTEMRIPQGTDFVMEKVTPPP